MSASCLSLFRMVSGHAGWLAAFLIIATAASLHAQPPTIAVGGGYEWGEVNIEFLEKSGRSSNDAFNSGTNLFVGFAELAFPVNGNGSLMVAVRLSGYNANVVLIAPMPEVQVMIPGGPEPSVEGIDEEIAFSMRTIQLELIGRVALVEGLRLGAGPVLGYRAIQDYRHSYLYEVPINIRPWTWPNSHLEDDGHRVVDDNETNVYNNRLAIGVLFTAEYEFPLRQQLLLVPELRLRGDFTSPFANTNWNLFSAGGAVSIRYSL